MAVKTEALRPLTGVCARLHLDYFRARAAIIRGEARGEQVAGRWLADEEDLRRWQVSRTSPRVVTRAS
jgi:hypothetical protein